MPIARLKNKREISNTQALRTEKKVKNLLATLHKNTNSFMLCQIGALGH